MVEVSNKSSELSATSSSTKDDVAELQSAGTQSSIDNVVQSQIASPPGTSGQMSGATIGGDDITSQQLLQEERVTAVTPTLVSNQVNEDTRVSPKVDNSKDANYGVSPEVDSPNKGTTQRTVNVQAPMFQKTSGATPTVGKNGKVPFAQRRTNK